MELSAPAATRNSVVPPRITQPSRSPPIAKFLMPPRNPLYGSFTGPRRDHRACLEASSGLSGEERKLVNQVRLLVVAEISCDSYPCACRTLRSQAYGSLESGDASPGPSVQTTEP